MKYVLHTCFFSILLGQAATAKNLTPYEPGATSGCNWSGEIVPAPDLVGKRFEDVRNPPKGVTIKVVGQEKSPYYRKGIVNRQDPEPCGRWPNDSRVVSVFLSSGKSELEAAFVKADNKFLVPYDFDKFGPVEMSQGGCVSKKGQFPVFDIASQVREPSYDKSACSMDTFGFQKGHPEKAAFKIQVDLLKNVAKLSDPDPMNIDLTAKFENISAKPVSILFAGYWMSHFHVINPGFRVQARSAKKGFYMRDTRGRRFHKLIQPSESVELKAALNIPKDTKPGIYWLTFAFMNLLNEDIYVASEPVKLQIL